jgi:hypothetical protein
MSWILSSTTHRTMCINARMSCPIILAEPSVRHHSAHQINRPSLSRMRDAIRSLLEVPVLGTRLDLLATWNKIPCAMNSAPVAASARTRVSTTKPRLSARSYLHERT